MTAVSKHLVTLMLLVSYVASCAFAQVAAGPASVRKVAVTHEGTDLRVEILLTSPVQPSIETAVNPDRILLDFPGTVSGETPKVEVNTNGVRRVRTGQHSAAPPVTRIVLDLDQAHPYTMKVEGNRIIVMVAPVENASKIPHTGGAPAPAMSGGLTGLFRKKPPTAPPMTADRVPANPVPPPALPPFTASPAGSSAPVVVATGTVSVPSAKSTTQPQSGTLPTFSTTVVPGGVGHPGGEVAVSGFPAATAGTPTTNQGEVGDTTFDAKGVGDAAAAPDAKAAEEKVAADRLAADRLAADKLAEAKAAEEKVAADKLEADKLAEAKAAEKKAAADKVEADKLAEAKAAELRVADEKAVQDKAAQDKAAQDKAAQDKAAQDKVAQDKVAQDQEKAAADAKLAEATAAEQKAAALKAESDALAALQKGAEDKVAEVKAAEVKAAEDKTAVSLPAEAAVPEAKIADAPALTPAEAALAAMPPSADGVPVASTPVPVETMLMTRADDPSLRTVFKVKYVADGVAYLEGGRAQGLTEGMKLQVEETNLPTTQGASAHAATDPRVVAELEVSGVAETSSVTEIHDPKRAVKAGDLAYLSASDTESLVAQRSLSSTRQYPAVVSFSADDTLDDEAREEVPRPPSPAVNRARGRIGLDYNSTTSHGLTSVTSSNIGFSFRGDITRIGGTFWNLSGYYRGRFTKQATGTQQTLQDLINHTYHLSLTYENPNSRLVAGVGRLYLPWASSLDTIDGGYFGYHPKQGVTMGVFGGSTPDPTSWTYAPNRAISGTFVNFEGGSYDHFHYTSTSGAGVSMINWAVDRPFLFFEDTLSFGRKIGVYESAQLDSPVGNPAVAAPGAGLGRSFFTLRVQPAKRLELNFNHNYFRDLPKYDPTLPISLLDKFLFQGFSVGARVEVLDQVFVSTSLGRSNRSGDKGASLNQMYGLTFNRLPLWKLRADARYSKFSSSFGTGSYESFSLSRQLSDALRIEFLGGQQNFTTQVSANGRSRFFTSTTETTLGPHYYLQGNFTMNRGEISYDQYLFSFGYRFDNRAKGR